jgi:2-polyprenyl-6-methoxyphenol hydroxylase-like FAD-dependent oxidoreductase
LGASIENQHITAALLARLQESGKCEVIQQKVSAVKPAKNASELPLITLEDGTTIEP